MVKGIKLNGSPIVAGSMKRISQGTAKLTEEDRTAMFAYLAKKEIKPKPQIAVATCNLSTASVVAGAENLAPAADDFIVRIAGPATAPVKALKAAFPLATYRQLPLIRLMWCQQIRKSRCFTPA